MGAVSDLWGIAQSVGPWPFVVGGLVTLAMFFVTKGKSWVPLALGFVALVVSALLHLHP